MDDDFEYTPPARPRPSRMLRWQNIGAVVLSGLGTIAEDVGEILEGVAHLLMSDGNYADDRASFHEEAAMELESLLGGEDG